MTLKENKGFIVTFQERGASNDLERMIKNYAKFCLFNASFHN